MHFYKITSIISKRKLFRRNVKRTQKKLFYVMQRCIIAFPLTKVVSHFITNLNARTRREFHGGKAEMHTN